MSLAKNANASEVKLRTYQAVEHTKKRENNRSIISYCFERATLLFAIKLALVVGTILALINHGQALISGHLTFDQLLPMLITYCVPFSVSMYSQVQGKRERDRLYAEACAASEQNENKAKGGE